MIKFIVKFLFSPSLFVFIFGLGLFYSQDLTVSNDMGEYMVYGFNLFSGKGYTAMDGSSVLFRGPVFSAMIAFSYLLGGVSPWSAFWVVRLFCVLTPLMIYFIGKKLFNQWVGFGGAILILSSYSTNYWAYRHIDAVWIFFVFVSLYLFIEGVDQMKNGLIVLSGINMGIAFLTKEVALLFFPLPILLSLVMVKYHGKRIYKIFFYFYGSLILSLTPWFYYVVGKGDLKDIFGAGAGLAKIAQGSEPFWQKIPNHISNLFQGTFHFFYGHSNSMDANYILTPLFVFALVYAIYKAVVMKHKSCQIVLCGLILFLPIVQLLGNINMRLGQGLYFYYLSFLLISFLIYDLAQYIFRVSQNPKKQVSTIFIFNVLICFLLVIQFFVPYQRDKGGWSFLKESYAASIFSDSKGPRDVHQLFTFEQKKIAEEIYTVLSDAQGIMVCDRKAYVTYWKPIYFFWERAKKIYLSPFLFRNIATGKLPITDRNKRDLILLDSKWGNHSELNYFVFLFEQDLYNDIGEKEIDYIVLENLSPLLSYFETNSGFREIITDSKVLKVFKVDGNLKKHVMKPKVTNRAVRYYKGLSKNEPEVLNRFQVNFFQPLLGLDKNETDKLFFKRL
jgi:Dolichyl-phosphate-mannose-protein mannosyltransferase